MYSRVNADHLAVTEASPAPPTAAVTPAPSPAAAMPALHESCIRIYGPGFNRLKAEKRLLAQKINQGFGHKNGEWHHDAQKRSSYRDVPVAWLTTKEAEVVREYAEAGMHELAKMTVGPKPKAAKPKAAKPLAANPNVPARPRPPLQVQYKQPVWTLDGGPPVLPKQRTCRLGAGQAKPAAAAMTGKSPKPVATHPPLPLSKTGFSNLPDLAADAVQDLGSVPPAPLPSKSISTFKRDAICIALR